MMVAASARVAEQWGQKLLSLWLGSVPAAFAYCILMVSGAMPSTQLG